MPSTGRGTLAGAAHETGRIRSAPPAARRWAIAAASGYFLRLWRVEIAFEIVTCAAAITSGRCRGPSSTKTPQHVLIVRRPSGVTRIRQRPVPGPCSSRPTCRGAPGRVDVVGWTVQKSSRTLPIARQRRRGNPAIVSRLDPPNASIAGPSSGQPSRGRRRSGHGT